MELNAIKEKHLTDLVLDKNFFWNEYDIIFKRYDVESNVTLDEFKDYLLLFENLLEKVKPWLVQTFSKRTLERNILIISAAFLLKKTSTLATVMNRLFKKSFEAFQSEKKRTAEVVNEFDNSIISNESVDDLNCQCCQHIKDDCKCKSFIQMFNNLKQIIDELQLVEHVANPSIVFVVYRELSSYIEQNCKGEFFEAWLSNVFHWMNTSLTSWLEFATNKQVKQVVADTDCCFTVEQWQPRLEYFVYKAFAELRISELFEIIVEYPDSLPAINDLKDCLLQTETRQLLTKSLTKSFENRLLHPAVNTDDILTQYVSAIRTLRELDHTGVILENVCTPLREYLRGRDDTIKCIITCLTDQEASPGLAEELLGTDTIGDKELQSDSDGEDWVPDPIDAKADLSSKDQRTADIINILVNIFGSQDMFVSQYRVLLADRILTNFSYDVTNERRYLELLKRRFGETHLHFCDIMLKDIQDSQRINRLVKDDLEKSNKVKDDLEKSNTKDDTKEEEAAKSKIDFNSFIISSAFWPSLSEDSIEPPEEVKLIMEEYTNVFKQSKGGNRTLNWYLNVGSVELEVEVDDGMKTFHVTPAQATLLLKFQEQDEWTSNDLAQALNVSKSLVRSRTAFWIGQGVIIEKQNDVFVATTSFNSQMADNCNYESDEDSGATSSQNQKDEELQVYWSYVMGMLRNLGSLPLERIHAMLKMFAMAGDSSSQCTLAEVKLFLQGKVNDGELIYTGGMYKLPPKSN